MQQTYIAKIKQKIGVDRVTVFVVKRDGRTEEFNREKIKFAVSKAWDSVYPTKYLEKEVLVEKIGNQVQSSIQNNTNVNVEDIHELVIEALTQSKPDVGVSYARYYTTRKTRLEMEMDLTSRISRLVSGDKELNNENANKDSRTFSTKRDLMAGQVSKSEGLKMLPVHVREAHLRGDIHFHDLDYSPYLPYTNCCLVDLEHMYNNGFNMGNAVIGKPKSIQTAVAQAAQVVANVSSSQYGLN